MKINRSVPFIIAACMVLVTGCSEKMPAVNKKNCLNPETYKNIRDPGLRLKYRELCEPVSDAGFIGTGKDEIKPIPGKNHGWTTDGMVD